MNRRWIITAVIVFCCVGLAALWTGDLNAAPDPAAEADPFPRTLESYDDSDLQSIGAILRNRISEEPFNLIATLIFILAIIHTFLTAKFITRSHKWEHEHQKKIESGEAPRDSVHHGAELFHFLGEVEAVFGIWAIALIAAIIGFYDWHTVVDYIGHTVNFTEPAFVVVIMTLAATRPILRLTENMINGIAKALGGSLTARWLTTLTIGPILGSFITEPAAMTITALVLARTFYDLEPSNKFKYARWGCCS
jgi:NADH:ubiquinone oxidoreductase subunit 3 (subunit A)